MKESIYKTYDELPLFLNAETVAQVLGVSPSSGYELMHEQGFWGCAGPSLIRLMFHVKRQFYKYAKK